MFRLLAALQAKEFLYERPAFPEMEYFFKHALTQEVAYGTLLQERRKALHERTGAAMEALHTDSLEDHYGELAHHYGRSGNAEKTIVYLHLAGQQAAQRSAHSDAIRHVTAALDQLQTLSDSAARVQQELVLQTTLGPLFMMTKGFAAPEVEQAYARARELCQRVGDSPELFPVLYGLFQFYISRAELHIAYELGQQCRTLAERIQDPALFVVTRFLLGSIRHWQTRPRDYRPVSPPPGRDAAG